MNAERQGQLETKIRSYNGRFHYEGGPRRGRQWKAFVSVWGHDLFGEGETKTDALRNALRRLPSNLSRHFDDIRVGIREQQPGGSVIRHAAERHGFELVKLPSSSDIDLYEYGPANIEIDGSVGGRLWWATIRFQHNEKTIEATSSEEALDQAKDYVDSLPEISGFYDPRSKSEYIKNSRNRFQEWQPGGNHIMMAPRRKRPRFPHRHEDDLVKNPELLPNALAERYEQEFRKHGLRATIVDSRTEMPRAWDFANTTELSINDLYFIIRLNVAQDEISGFASKPTRSSSGSTHIIETSRATNAEPVIQALVGAIAAHVRE